MYVCLVETEEKRESCQEARFYNSPLKKALLKKGEKEEKRGTLVL